MATRTLTVTLDDAVDAVLVQIATLKRTTPEALITPAAVEQARSHAAGFRNDLVARVPGVLAKATPTELVTLLAKFEEIDAR